MVPEAWQRSQQELSISQASTDQSYYRCKHPWSFTLYVLNKILVLFRDREGVVSWPRTFPENRAGLDSHLSSQECHSSVPLERMPMRNMESSQIHILLLELDTLGTRLENGNCGFCPTRQRRELNSHTQSLKNPKLPRNYIKKPPKHQPLSGILSPSPVL